MPFIIFLVLVLAYAAKYLQQIFSMLLKIKHKFKLSACTRSASLKCVILKLVDIIYILISNTAAYLTIFIKFLLFLLSVYWTALFINSTMECFLFNVCIITILTSNAFQTGEQASMRQCFTSRCQII